MSYPNQPDSPQGQYSQQGYYPPQGQHNPQQGQYARPKRRNILVSMSPFNLRIAVLSLLGFGASIWLFASGGAKNPVYGIALIAGSVVVFTLNLLWVMYKARR